ncbi:MAG: ATP-binding protein [Novosphingobium sp.]
MANAGASKGPDRFFIKLGNDISAVEEVRQALLAYLENFRLEPMVVNRVEVILEELVSNVARHADAASYVSVGAEYADGAIAIRIEDDGAAFNPLEKRAPAAFTDVESATLGGQGIPLIKRLSRSVRYDRVDEANRISVVIAA